jgi:hypothetical protein
MKYFLISFGVLLLIIFGIVIFNRGGTKTVTSPGRKPVVLMDYVNNQNATVQFSTEGPINAIENHRTTVVTIGPSSRNVSVYGGYQGQALVNQSYVNDKNSYSAFLAALNRAGFTRDRKLANGVNSESVCPTGSRSHYLIVENGKDVMDLWSATCTAGSYGGNVSLTSTLFQAQIPSYSSVVNVPATAVQN